MNRRIAFIIFGSLVIAAFVTAALVKRKSDPILRGRLSQADQKETTKLIYRTVWHQSFPDFSWRTVRTAPWSLYRILELRIEEFTATAGLGIQVTTSVGGDPDSKRFWWLARGRNGWKLMQEQSSPFDLKQSGPLLVTFDPTFRVDGSQMQTSALLSPVVGPTVSRLQAIQDSLSPPPFSSNLFDDREDFTHWLSNHSGLSIDGGR